MRFVRSRFLARTGVYLLDEAAVGFMQTSVFLQELVGTGLPIGSGLSDDLGGDSGAEELAEGVCGTLGGRRAAAGWWPSRSRGQP
jgi:hypothetical protein